LRRFLFGISLAVLAALAVSSRAQEKLPLKLVATTPMPGYTGDFDHFGLDLKGNRLFLASENQKQSKSLTCELARACTASKVSLIR